MMDVRYNGTVQTQDIDNHKQYRLRAELAAWHTKSECMPGDNYVTRSLKTCFDKLLALMDDFWYCGVVTEERSWDVPSWSWRPVEQWCPAVVGSLPKE